MASSRTKLRNRWKTELGQRTSAEIHRLIGANAERACFLSVLEGFPLSQEVPGFVDLRGLPLRTAVSSLRLHRLDMSYAQADKNDSSLGNHVMVSAGSYRDSRFDQIKSELEFVTAEISGSSLVASNLRDVMWWTCREDTDFDSPSRSRHLHDLDLSRSKLTSNQFRLQWLKNCDFSGADLSSASFFNVVIENCTFKGADLTEALFVRCEFLGSCDFEGARLVNTEIDPAIAGEAPLRVPGGFEKRFIEAAIEHFESVSPNPRFAEILKSARTDPAILDSLQSHLTSDESADLEFELKQVSKNLWW